MIYTTRKPRPTDAYLLYAHMRPQDRDECVAFMGHAPSALELWLAMEEQDEAYAVHTEDALVCIYGVKAGVPWLLGTKALDHRMMSLCKQARPVIERWLATYGTLSNVTSKHNRRVLAWLRWLGFSFGPTDIINGHPFIRFYK
jgi:hypothetical protein